MNGRLEIAAQNKQALREPKLSGADDERWAGARLVAEMGARWLKAQIDRAGE